MKLPACEHTPVLTAPFAAQSARIRFPLLMQQLTRTLLSPYGLFREAEGLTFILDKQQAERVVPTHIMFLTLIRCTRLATV